MNDVLKVIHKRRSTRFFKSDVVNRELLTTIIEAGNMAPTGTSQSWRFVTVTDANLLDRLKHESVPLYKGFLENMPQGFKDVRAKLDAVVSDPVFYSAPALIYVIGKGNARDADCNMVSQNIMLAAESLGLNSCYAYFGQLALQKPEFKELFKISDGEKVYGPILLGYGSQQSELLTKKNPPSVLWI